MTPWLLIALAAVGLVFAAWQVVQIIRWPEGKAIIAELDRRRTQQAGDHWCGCCRCEWERGNPPFGCECDECRRRKGKEPLR